MSDEKSLARIRDFAMRIENLHIQENEVFVRWHLSCLMNRCPIGVLKNVANVVLLARQNELTKESQDN